MLKAGKIGMAIVMGLLLSLTLLASGALAEDTANAQSTVSTGNRVAAFAGGVQQGVQELRLVASSQQLKAGQVNTLSRWRPRRAWHFRRSWRTVRVWHPRRVWHFRRNWHFRRAVVRCRWVSRGWGRWRRVVRICSRW